MGSSTVLYWRTPGTSDVEIWLNWIGELLTHGPTRGYAHLQSDYPPGASLVLWIVGHVAAGTHGDLRTVLKWLVLAFLLGTTGLLIAGCRRALLAAFAHAALVTNSLGLLYLDIFTAPFILGAVWAARARREAMMLCLIGGACVMKWQPLLVLPFAAAYVGLQRHVIDKATWSRKLIWAGAMLAGVTLFITAAYGLYPIVDSLYRASRHNNLSNFGANPLWMLTWWLETAGPERIGSLSPTGLVSIAPASRPMLRGLSLLTLVVYAATLRKYWKSGDRTVGAFLRFALVGYLVYFMFSAGVHENHLFLASLLAIALAWQEPKHFWLAVLIAAAANLNLVAFYGWTGEGAHRFVIGVDATVWVALVTSAVLGTISWLLIFRFSESARGT